MADTLQYGSISGSASVRQKISGEVVIGGKVMKELRFLPYSEFPEIGREETLYIDTDNNAMYYYDGSAYVALSGGGTDNYNALSNKPSVNSVTLIGNKTSSELGLQELISDLSAIRSGATSGSTAVQPETLETALSEKQDTINDLDDIRSGASAGATAVQPSDMETALADKQDVISDLSTIRSGAASGATAVQPDDMETALSSKQDVISDLSDIRSGASAGATAVQPADMESALSGKQDTISDLQTIRSGAALGATAVQPADMETALADKQNVIADLDTIRSGATAGNTALQPEDVDTLPTDGSSNPVSSGGTYNFVNSSIATNTAYFIGTFASVEELEAYTGTVTNNDYAFVTSTDSAGNTLYNRYKYNAATQVWSFEYAVNNTAFTTAQWAAIQSGMTSADKTKLDGIEQGANKTVIDASPTSGSDNAVSSGGVHTALSGKQDTISDLSDIRSGASAGATAVQPSALNDYQTKLSGTNKLDPSYIDYDASHRAVSDTEKSTWNGKQDAISDIDTIRSGAAAGATALQQSDVSSTYSSSGTAPVNGTAVNAAIGTLDVSSVGGSGKYISAISEADGKIEATPITFDTALSSSSTNNNTPTSKAVYDDQQRQEVEIGDIANRGAKNLLNPDNYIKKSTGGLTITETGTGTYKITGTPSGTVDVFTTPSGTFDRMYGLEVGKTYTISGLPTGNGLLCRIDVSKNNSGSWDAQIISNLTLPQTFTVPSDATGLYIRYRVTTSAMIPSGGISLEPMIRPASITDSTFVPYAKTNRELTVENISQQSEIDYAVNTGVKNFLDVQRPTTTTRTSYTPLANGGVELSCSNATWTSYAIADIPVEVGKEYIITFLLDESSGTSNFYFFLRNGDSSGTNLATKNYGSTTGNYEASFTPNNSVIWLGIYLNNSATAATATAKLRCMIRPASITDPTFQPYALPNPTLTPAAIKAVDEGAKNLSPQADGSSSSSWVEFGIDIPAGAYVLSFTSLTSTDTDSSTIQVAFFDADDNAKYIQVPRGSNVSKSFTTVSARVKCRVYKADSHAHGSGDTVTFTGCMICTAADWAVSQKFVPYCPSMTEMYEKQPVLKQITYSATSTDYEKIDALTANIPPASTMKFYISTMFNNCPARGIILSSANDASSIKDSNIFAKIESADNVGSLNASALVRNTSSSNSKPMYVYAKFRDAKKNNWVSCVTQLL